MSVNWWAERLSGAKPPPPPPSTPPTTMYPQQPVYVPPAQGYQQPQQPTYYPPTQHAQPALRPGQRQQLLDPRRAPTEQIPMGEAIHLWQGGEAHRLEGDMHCPDCGSQHFYSRAKGGVGGKPPAPRCFECGYTGGLFTQADQANWAV